MSTAAKLKELRARSGLSMAEAAERMDLKRASSYQYYESETGYGRERLPPHLISKLKAAFVGLGDPPITADDIDEMDRAPPSEVSPISDISFSSGATPTDRAIIRDMLRTAYGVEFIRVPVYDMASAESVDALVRGLNSSQALFVDATWFASAPGRPRDAGAYVVMAGDAMSPSIRAGDMLFVDRTARTITVEGVYLLAVASSVALRRCVRDVATGAIRMSVDNPHYPLSDDESSPAGAVLGRVTLTVQCL